MHYCSLGEDISESVQKHVPTYKQQFQEKGLASAITTVKGLYKNAVWQAKIALENPLGFNFIKANALTLAIDRANAALVALTDVFGETAAVYEKHKSAMDEIRSNIDWLVKNAEALQKLDPNVAEAARLASIEKYNAFAAGELDHPSITKEEKAAILANVKAGAYENLLLSREGADPVSAASVISLKYNLDTGKVKDNVLDKERTTLQEKEAELPAGQNKMLMFGAVALGAIAFILFNR